MFDQFCCVISVYVCVSYKVDVLEKLSLCVKTKK